MEGISILSIVQANQANIPLLEGVERTTGHGSNPAFHPLEAASRSPPRSRVSRLDARHFADGLDRA
ncbi:MAG: hypothetical protein MW690_001391 [Methanophagales archaeon]|nr:hypothetical protein [Methanophagales archaeon]